MEFFIRRILDESSKGDDKRLLTMIIESTGGVEWRWARRGGTSGGTVGAPASLLMIDLPAVRVPDHVDLLVLDGLVPVLPLLQRRGSLLHAMALLQNARRIALLLLLRIVHAIRPRVGLPLLGHEAARHVGAVVVARCSSRCFTRPWRSRIRRNLPAARNLRRCYTTVITGTLTKTAHQTHHRTEDDRRSRGGRRRLARRHRHLYRVPRYTSRRQRRCGRRCCDAVASVAAFRHSAPSVSVTCR